MMNHIDIWMKRTLPVFAYNILFAHKYFHFFATGITGVGLNLIATWLLTRFVFGLENYFSAYLIGVVVNLLFNFTMHTVMTFKAKDHVLKRMVGFVAYSVSMTTFQAWLVKTITPMIGLEYYLVIIAGVILVFSVVTFLLFKFFLFKTIDKEGVRDVVLLPIFSATLLHITGFLEFGDRIPEIFFSLVPTHTHPLLSLFLSLGGNLHGFLLAQLMFSAIMLPLGAYLFTRHLFGERVGVILLWVIALEPVSMILAWIPAPHIPYVGFLLLALVLLASMEGWRGSRFCLFARAILAILSALVASIIFPEAAIVGICLFGVYIIRAVRQKDRLVGISAFLALCASLLS